ncbi:hypothetical protein AB0I22_39585 [Streptomyces sp. NPDC050610]|uniref:hypothetical protein n=1 Tax=Streptomyces sp. NPDC050610 TaxID=3157097 RepID=UPI00342A4DA8
MTLRIPDDLTPALRASAAASRHPGIPASRHPGIRKMVAVIAELLASGEFGGAFRRLDDSV